VKRLLEYEAEDSTTVLVEVDDEEPGFVRASGADRLAGRAAKTLRDALTVIGPTAQVLVERIGHLPTRPSEAVVEFGVRLNGSAGAVIASSEAEGHFKVRLTWRNPAAPSAVDPEESTEADW
jgi:Trypsin-co-occurring domain 1